MNFHGMENNNNTSRVREVFVDLESGENGSPGDLSSDPNPVADDKQGNRFLNNLASRVLRYNISATSGSDSDSDSTFDKASQDSQDKINLLIDKNAGRQRDEQIPLLEKVLPHGKQQSTNSKMASKPPRPPRGPSLDSSDLMLVQEISEIVMKKRARKERIKAFKSAKARAAKLSSSPSTSSNNTLCSLVVTVVFLLILIFHGIPWRTSSTSILPDSPGPSTGTNGLISVQVFSNPLPNHGISPTSESPSSVEQSFGSGLTSPG